MYIKWQDRHAQFLDMSNFLTAEKFALEKWWHEISSEVIHYHQEMAAVGLLPSCHAAPPAGRDTATPVCRSLSVASASPCLYAFSVKKKKKKFCQCHHRFIKSCRQLMYDPICVSHKRTQNYAWLRAWDLHWVPVWWCFALISREMFQRKLNEPVHILLFLVRNLGCHLCGKKVALYFCFFIHNNKQNFYKVCYGSRSRPILCNHWKKPADQFFTISGQNQPTNNQLAPPPPYQRMSGNTLLSKVSCVFSTHPQNWKRYRKAKKQTS